MCSGNDDELNAATEAWFGDQTDDFYFKGIDCLKEKWAKYIEVEGITLKMMLKQSSNLRVKPPSSMNLLNSPRTSILCVNKQRRLWLDCTDSTEVQPCLGQCSASIYKYHYAFTGLQIRMCN